MNHSTEDKLATLTLVMSAYQAAGTAPTDAKLMAAVKAELHSACPTGSDALLSSALRRLRDAGWITIGKAQCTVAGKRVVGEFLDTRIVKWGSKKRDGGGRDFYLPKKILGLGAKPKSVGEDWLRAHLLNDAYNLSMSPFSSIARTRDRLTWVTLAGMDLTAFAEVHDKPFTMKALGMALCKSVAGRSATSDSPHLQVANLALAAHLQLDTAVPTSEDVRAAVYLTWLTDEQGPAIDLPSSNQSHGRALSGLSDGSSGDDQGSGDDSLDEAFVRAVLASARDCTPWTAGSRDVYISDVWARFRHQPEAKGVDYEAFKRRLVQAQRDHLILLLEAQLVSAMDLERIEASEVKLTPRASRHLLRAEEVHP